MKNRIWNEYIRKGLGVENIEKKMKESRLRWFGHVQRWDINQLVRKIERWCSRDLKRGRGRSKIENNLEDKSRKRYKRSKLTNWDGRKSEWMEKTNLCGRPLKMIYWFM